MFLKFLIINTLIFNNNFLSLINIHSNHNRSARGIYVYFDQDHTQSKTIYHSYYRDDEYYFGIFNYSLSWNIPVYFAEVKVLGQKDCYTKTSWGDTSYYGTELWKKINNQQFLDIAENTRIRDTKIKVFLKYANIKLLDIYEYYMSAFIISKQYIGFTWYFDNIDKRFYLQILVYYYTRVWGSASNGGRWLNIGKGLDIAFKA